MKKKKNIIVFLNAFWRSGEGMSGGDQMFLQLFGRLRSSFDHFYIYTNKDGKNAVAGAGLDDIRYKISAGIFDKFNVLASYIFRTLKALNCLRLKEVDVLYSTSDFFPDVLPAYIYKIFHKKTVWFQCVFHICPDWRFRKGNKIKNFIAQYLQKYSLFLIQRADCVININSIVSNYLAGKGFDAGKLVINTPGINLKYFEDLGSEKNLTKYDAVILARLSPTKGIFDLVEIWKLVVLKNSSARLAIIGGGDLSIKNELLAKIKVSNLENNIFVLGYLPDNEAFQLIKNSKVFVFPSHEEGFGISIAEAMACGVPVVSWDLPVYREIFEDQIICVKENDVQVLAEKVNYLLSDDKARHILALKAGQFIKKYDWGRITSDFYKILNKYGQIAQ